MLLVPSLYIDVVSMTSVLSASPSRHHTNATTTTAAFTMPLPVLLLFFLSPPSDPVASLMFLRHTRVHSRDWLVALLMSWLYTGMSKVAQTGLSYTHETSSGYHTFFRGQVTSCIIAPLMIPNDCHRSQHRQPT